MRVIPSNSSTAALRRIPFTLVDATDLVTPEDITVTGVKVSLSIDGGTPANSTNDIVKVSGSTGEYYIELTQSEANQTAGAIVRGSLTPSGCALTKLVAQIGPGEVMTSPWDVATSGHTTSGTFGERVTRIPNVAAGANGGLPTVDGSNRIAGMQGTITTLDALDTAQDTQHATTQGYIDTEIASIISTLSSITSTLSTIAGYIDTEVAAIKAKTDNLPSDPADASDIAALLSTAQTAINAIKAKTDKLAFATMDDSATERLNVNATHQNEVLIAGTGVVGDKFRGAPTP